MKVYFPYWVVGIQILKTQRYQFFRSDKSTGTACRIHPSQ